MRSAKPQSSLINFKFVIFVFLFLGLAFLILNSNFSSASSSSSSSSPSASLGAELQNRMGMAAPKTQNCPSACNIISPSLSQAIIHYATSNITPQQTFDEISVTERVLRRKSPCNFLVFGLGYDSLMWASLNHGGRTVFLEEDDAWIRQITLKFPTLKSHHVVYDTKVRNSDDLLSTARAAEECRVVADPRESKCVLALKGLPEEVYEIEWDLIMVDAPTGYHEEAPGRMSAIYTAGLMGRNRKEGETDVFVHDVDRSVEDKFSKEFLCEGYMMKQEGRLRHFTLPSHSSHLGKPKPFCPPTTDPNA